MAPAEIFVAQPPSNGKEQKKQMEHMKEIKTNRMKTSRKRSTAKSKDANDEDDRCRRRKRKKLEEEE